MKVSLIFPNINYRRLDKHILHPPLGLAYLGAVLERRGDEVQVIDAAVLNLSFPELERQVSRFDPGVIGLTANIGTYLFSCYTARVLKRTSHSAKMIFGGPWATVNASLLLRMGLADIVVLGEGECTVEELMRCLENDGDLADVTGIAFRDKAGVVVQTGPRAMLEDLDSLPLPAWHLLPPSRLYTYNNRSTPCYPIMTSRGCPFDCIYCTKIIHGYRLRYRSVDNVINELRYLKSHFKVKEVIIADDTFTQDPVRAGRILDRIHADKLGMSLLLSNGIRSDIYSDAFVARMRRAGVYRVCLGIESGNQDVLRSIKKQLKLEDVTRFVALLRKYRIDHIGYFMLGLPEDTWDTMMDTVFFAVHNRIQPHFHKTIAVPGTKLHEQVKHKLVPRGYGNQTSYSSGGATFETYPGQGRDLQRALRVGYLRYYMSPHGVLQVLGNTRSFLDVKWLLNSALRVLQLINYKK